jgi:hypothetical protein
VFAEILPPQFQVRPLGDFRQPPVECALSATFLPVASREDRSVNLLNKDQVVR